MASVYDYTFYEPTRVGEDKCDISQRNVQNSDAATWMLDNFRPDCPMSNAIDFATSQPNVNFTGSHQVGINGCNIDNNSELSITKITKPKCRISLLERPFATVPYLGRGRSNPVLESKLLQGDLANNRKSANPSSEVCYIGYQNTPMIPSLKETITNPANLCESSAAEGWIRGGLPSRDLTRDKDYATTHSKHQYV
tara:strand:+ start:496 stop:1083 length:588 start_codon:yes stop_codon:yes gene_type:complete